MERHLFSVTKGEVNQMEKKKRKQNTKIVDFCSNWGILPDNIALLIEDDEDAFYEGIVEFSYEDTREVRDAYE